MHAAGSGFQTKGWGQLGLPRAGVAWCNTAAFLLFTDMKKREIWMLRSSVNPTEEPSLPFPFPRHVESQMAIC